jgi:lipopolysaccharide transport system ATP-binding protein
MSCSYVREVGTTRKVIGNVTNAAAISVEGLSKQYHIGRLQPSYRTLRDSIADAATAPLRRLRSFGRPSYTAGDTIWALRDVSFQVQRGEVLGVIGHNGSGKTTLLRLLAGIAAPTSGQARIIGRVTTLLGEETGFHPELTGRENVILRGVVLGMTRRLIKQRFDAIVDYAGIARFVDTPIKHYSAGMCLRLGFSIAAHLDADVLLVDEVLAEGDEAFQRRCLSTMGEATQEGRTILFVSHDLHAVRRLCDRAICLQHGKIIMEGDSDTAVDAYLKSPA